MFVRKRKPCSLETKRKLSIANLGKKHSEETKKKMSESRQGRLPWNKGLTKESGDLRVLKNYSVERGKKISKTLKERKVNSGRIHTEEFKQYLSKVMTTKDPGYKRVCSFTGYVVVKIRNRFWKSEHRLVMEESLGRELQSDEFVHHEDLDRSNNSLKNLSVMTPSEHSSWHRKHESRPHGEKGRFI